MDSKENPQTSGSNLAQPSTTYQRAPVATGKAGGRRPLNSPSTRHLLEQKSSEDEDLQASQGMVKSSSRSQIDEEEIRDDRPRTPILNGPIIELRGREVIFAIGVFFLVAIVVGLIVVLASSKVQELDGAKGGSISNSSTFTLKFCARCQEMVKHFKEEAEKYCVSPQCVSIAARIYENLDPTVDPCDDFFKYACGGWLARTEIPSSMDSWGIDDEITMKVRMKVKRILESPINRNETESAERKFKTFYQKCIDTASMEHMGVTPFLNIIDEFGGWALLPDWNLGDKSGLWKVQRALEILHFDYDVDAFFSHVIARDDNDSTVNIIQFDQGGLTLTDRSDYMRDENSPIIVAYKNYILKIASLFNASKAESDLLVEAILRVEKRLAHIHEDENSERRQSPKDLYNKLTINELGAIAPRIDWLSFLSEMYDGIQGDTEILVTNPYYLGNISELIRTSNESDLNNYFVWQLMHKFAAPFLTYDISEAHTSFKKVMRKIPTVCDNPEDRRQNHIRQAFCQKQTNEWFGNAVAAHFVQGNATAMELDVENMIENIKGIFRNTFKTCWMDKSTEQAAKDKIDNMRSQIGYPKFIMNETLLDEYYEGFEVDESLSFLENVVLALRHQRALRKRALETNDQSEDWSMNPTEVNAFYSFSENIVGFTAGLLQAPYYDLHYPKYVSYATLGSTIAHEITHAFDRSGALYDKSGNLRGWWTDKTWEKFVTETSCINEYYHKLRIDGIEGEIHTEELNENIADIGGLKHAYQAYKSWRESEKVTERMLPILGMNLTNDKVFFISFAQNWCKSRRLESIPNFARRSKHALEEFRVKGSLAQNDDFKNAFTCKAGSRMNPSQKCIIW